MILKPHYEYEEFWTKGFDYDVLSAENMKFLEKMLDKVSEDAVRTFINYSEFSALLSFNEKDLIISILLNDIDFADLSISSLIKDEAEIGDVEELKALKKTLQNFIKQIDKDIKKCQNFMT